MDGRGRWLLHCYFWVSEFEGKPSRLGLECWMMVSRERLSRSPGEAAQGQRRPTGANNSFPQEFGHAAAGLGISESAAANRLSPPALAPQIICSSGELAGFVRWSCRHRSQVPVAPGGAAVAETSHHPGFLELRASRARQAARRANVILPPGSSGFVT